MKVLKLTFEIPLAKKSHVADMAAAAALVEKFKEAVKEAGMTLFAIEETIVSRPGRD